MDRKLVIGIGIGVLVVWLLIGFSPMFFFGDAQARGTFGDMFGAVNALFSGLALAGIVCAILLQREELKLQRRELELTREELSEQRAEFRRQTEQARVQNDILTEQLKAAKAQARAAAIKETLSSLPQFRYAGGSDSSNHRRLDYINVGATVFDVRVTSETEGVRVHCHLSESWQSNERTGFEVASANPSVSLIPSVIRIEFTTVLAETRSARISVPLHGQPTKISNA